MKYIFNNRSATKILFPSIDNKSKGVAQSIHIVGLHTYFALRGKSVIFLGSIKKILEWFGALAVWTKFLSGRMPRPMKSLVLFVTSNFKILDPIISFYTINMMDMLTRNKRSIQVLFHKIPMFTNCFSVSVNHSIATFCYKSIRYVYLSFIKWIAMSSYLIIVRLAELFSGRSFFASVYRAFFHGTNLPQNSFSYNHFSI